MSGLFREVDFIGNSVEISEIAGEIDSLCDRLSGLSVQDRVYALNQIKLKLHEVSPFSQEPVDCVLWVSSDEVEANDYNPNSVAAPEMDLLKISIGEDGYTQPIVSWKREGVYEVVDGFHRNRVGKEDEDIRARVHGYLPLTIINDDRLDKGDRIAATIRHNRARGKHRIDAMSDIVLDLKRRNWSHKKIATQLGMDQDEILRLTQISGLAEMFKDKEFSEAWEAEQLKDIDFEGDHENLD